LGTALVLLVVGPVRIFGQTASLAPAAAAGQAYSTGAAPESGAQPTYPGLGPGEGKAEAEMGAYKVRIYGTVLLNTSVSSAGIFGQDVPLWTLPSTLNVAYLDGTVGHFSDNHDLLFTMRQSVFGFAVNPANSKTNAWTPSGLFELDFFGTRAVDTVESLNRVLNQPRLRLAYFQLERNGLKLVFGQDK